LILLLLLVAASPRASGQALAPGSPTTVYLPLVWKPEPPRWMGPFGGSVVCMVVDPANPEVVYAGSWGAGVFKSTNGGKTWAWAGSGLGELHIDSLAIDPSNPVVLYAGTHGAAVYKTTNGGQSWFAAQAGMFPQAVVYTLAVNSGYPQIVYAGTRGAPAAPGPPWSGVLYRSTNGGASWQPVLTNVGGEDAQDWVYSVAANPSEPGAVLAATHEHGAFIAGNYGGPGDWQPADSVPDWSGRAVAFDPRSWTRAAYYATWHGDGIYKSSDGGSHWARSNAGMGFAKIYPNGIAIVSANPDTLYVASFGQQVHGVLKSNNAGAAWGMAGLADRYIYSVRAPEQENEVVFAGTLLDGFYRSENGGASWTRYQNGLLNASITGLVFTGPRTVYGSTYGGGVYVSQNGGSTWVDISATLGDRFVNGLVLHPGNPALLFALTESAGLRMYNLEAQRGWETAATVQPGLPAARVANDPSARQEPIESLLGYMPERSGDPNLAAASAPLLSMAFAPSDPQTVYLGTQGSGMYSSRDGGITWIPTGLAGQAVRSIAVHPANPKRLYAAVDSPGSVKTSANGGQSWSDIPIANLAVYTLAYLPTGSSVLYAGTNKGVWHLQGNEWVQAGLKQAVVTNLVSAPTWPGAFFAGTHSGGYHSYDGQSWILLAEESTGYTIQGITFDPADPHHVYLRTTTRGTLAVYLP
jgi:photosystem II stability/assembly factor-like uncharacterized protein